MAQIISVVNQKGGVGKTTTTVNLSSYLAAFGKRVLLVDIDPQANASSGLGIDIANIKEGIYDGLIGKKNLAEIIYTTNQDKMHIAPASIDLAGAGVELVGVENWEYKLLHALDSVKDKFDYILIDCPPSLGVLTVNGLVSSNKVLIPVQAEYYALEGLGQLLNTIGLIKENLNPKLDVLGAVITMFDKRVNLSREVFNELYKYFPNKIFRSIIPRNIRLTESPSHGKTILEYDPYSSGAKAYEKLAREIIDLTEIEDLELI